MPEHGGYILTYWKSKDSVQWSNAESIGLWQWLLVSAATAKQSIPGGSTIERGQVWLSLRALEVRLKMRRETIRRYLRTWEEDGAIKVQKLGRKGTIITLCNFDTYQVFGREGGSQTANKPQTNRKQTENKHAHTESPKSPKSPLESRERAASPKRARPGSLAEVEAYWAHAGLRGSPATFWNHYQARGWRGITDWLPLAANWSAREAGFAKGDKNRPADIDLTIPQGADR